MSEKFLETPIDRRTLIKGTVAAATLFFASSGLARAYEPSWPNDFEVADHKPRKTIQWSPIYPETEQKYNSMFEGKIPGYNLLRADTPGNAFDKLDIVTKVLKPGSSHKFSAKSEVIRIINAIKQSNTPHSSAGVCQGRADAAILDWKPTETLPVINAGGEQISFDLNELDLIRAWAYAACYPKDYAKTPGDIQTFINQFLAGVRTPFAGDVSLVPGEFWSTSFDGVSKDQEFLHGQDTLTGEGALFRRKRLLSAWRPQLHPIDPQSFLPTDLPLLPSQKEWWLQNIAGLDDRGIDMDVVNFLVHATPIPSA